MSQKGREWDYTLISNLSNLEVTSLNEQRTFPLSLDPFRIPNAYKLFDVLGNLREWSNDHQQGEPYALGWSFRSKGDRFDRSVISVPLDELALSEVGFRCIVVPIE